MNDQEIAKLATLLGERLQAAKMTCATAESCTGGWVAKALTDIAGSSAWFNGGVVTYSNDAKMTLLKVSRETLHQSGAVSEPTVLAMASEARVLLGADLAISVSGVAGPGGGSPAKPVGTVWFGLASGTQVRAWREQFDGNRDAVRRAAVVAGLRALLAV